MIFDKRSSINFDFKNTLKWEKLSFVSIDNGNNLSRHVYHMLFSACSKLLKNYGQLASGSRTHL